MEGSGPQRASLWRTLGNWHEDPRLIAWWEARVRGVFRLLPPARMRFVLALIAVGVCVQKALGREKELGGSPAWRLAVLLPILLGLPFLIWLVARRYETLPRFVRRRPQWTLHLVLGALVAAWCVVPAEGAVDKTLIVLVLAFLTRLVWRLGYILKTGQRGKAAKTSFADHLFYVWPLWGGSNTPYGKGYDYLVRNQAQNARDFARAQLAGLKLVLLALVWQGVQYLWAGAVFGDDDNRIKDLLHGHDLGIPRIAKLVTHRDEYSLGVAWISVYSQLVWAVLRLSATGHLWIGWLRILGFNVFRNTYKPLLAESVVEFWNRYYYYFKELLAEFFFFPTYASVQARPWLRTLVAVFAAAFVGNLYYHVLDEQALIVDGDPAALWAAFSSRTFYCFLLALGIWLSMMREQRRRGSQAPPRSGARRILSIACVWTFFALIHIWDHIGKHPTFEENTRFFLSLFGL